MWKSILHGGLLALPVLALGLWSQHWLEDGLEAQAEHEGRAVAAQAAASIASAQQHFEGELERMCRFDRRVDRLRDELRAAAPRSDARRSLAAIVTTLDLQSLEARAGAGAATVLRASPAPTRDADGAVTLPLSASCRLDGQFELHATRAHRVAGGQAAATWRVGERPADGHWLQAWAQTQGTSPSASLWLRIQPPDRPVAAIQAGTALAMLLAFGLAVWLRLGRGGALDAENTALTAIERAAERVAQGDLASHIGLTTGTSADRTLTAFNHMTEELRTTRARLMKAERAAAWQDMARRIAHEIKNPLSPIRTAMETLRRAHARGHADFDEIFEESSGAILEEVERLQRIVREFSEFARLPRPTPGAIDLRDTAQHAISVARHEGVNIQLDAPATLPAAHADREQLTQVLLNLLQNACLASRELRGEAARVELRLRARPTDLVIEVHDNGPGVPIEDRASVFQPYFTRREGGSGLGLAIATRIVEEHGGQLQVRESPLGGALFAFDLPLGPEGG